MVQSKPSISVVIPTYNREGMLSQALLSVLNQTYRVHEIIVVDDRSTLDIGNSLNNFSDERIRYIRHTTNKGPAAARNTGIALTTGDFVAFLDDDDQWFCNKIELQINAIRDCGAVICGFKNMSTGKVSNYRNEYIALRDLKSGNVLGGTSILMAQTSVMKETPFDERLRGPEDWDLYVRLARKHLIKNVRQCLVLYNDGAHARLTNERARISLSELEALSAVIEKHRQFLGPFWFNFRIAHILLSYITNRTKKLDHINRAIKRCGLVAVSLVLLDRLRNRIPGRRFL